MIHSLRPVLCLLAVGLLSSVADAQQGRAVSSGAPPASDVAAILRTPGALQARLRFDHLTTADGLSNDSVFSILQDRHGFLWFGTQAGLNRYDGYRVTQFRHDPNDPNSITSDFVHNLLEDRRGAIWTGNDALSRFDPDSGKFTTFALPRPDSSGGRWLTIGAMCEDRSGFLWLGMSGGRTLYRLDPQTGTFTGFDIGGRVPQGRENQIVGIYADPAGVLWLGSAYGLIRFDPVTTTSRLYNPAAGEPSHMSIRGIARDPDGSLWLATTEGGPNFFDRVTGAFSRRWLAPNPEQLATETNAVFAGADGVVWRGMADRLEVFDPATGAGAVLRHDAADRYSLSANEIQSIAADRDGGVWVGTKAAGVDRFLPAGLRFGAWRRNPADPHGLSDGNVRAIIRDRAGAVWIGTYDGGLNRFDPASGSFLHFRHDMRKPESLDADRVYSIYEDRSGDLWVGTSMGINRLDRATGTFTHFSRKPVGLGGLSLPTYSLLEDRRGVFWFGAGAARASLDRKTAAVTSVSDTGGLSMLEDREGSLWFASAHSLTRVDVTGKARNIALPREPGLETPSLVQINFMHQDAQGLLWFATETGLLLFDPKTERFTGFTAREGLPDNVVQCILPDSVGNLWLSTNNGLSRFDPRDRSFVNFHESDGLQSEQFNRKACFVDPAGTMYFGGLRGFNMFDPRRIPLAPREPPRVVLTEFRIHGIAVPVRPGSVLPKPVWLMNELNLPAADNAFSFDFAALQYNDQARTRYRFTLEGLENGWTEVDSRSRSARYTGLRPARYRFRVQASADGKIWSSREAAIGIAIAAPWWMTSWGQAGLFLMSAGLLFGAYKLRVRSLHERGVRLQRAVDQRTAELVEANREAQQARIQAEQASRAKSVFVANMSHELRTPLNAILGFSDLLRERSASEEQRRDLEMINRSGEHLLNLIDDVLDVARIEAGRIRLEMAPCDVKDLVRDVADLMRMRAAEKHLCLTLEESGEAPRYVRTDADRLRQVLINLVGNAIKFTEQGAIALRFGARTAAERDRVLLRFEIEDTGIGIAPEDRQRIFDPFEQGGRSRTQKGTGLGLAITRQILQLMGGTIELESSVGRGSCFRVEVPVEPIQQFDARPVSRDRVLGLEPGQPEYRVLVVEDEPANWMVLDRLLRDAGFEVKVAENGGQGVERFREWRPHFIWMDLRMPVMDGMEATRRIRVLDGGRDVKIAAVTVAGSDTRRAEALAAGLDDYVRKPHRPDEIFECMARHLGVRYRRAASSPVSQSDAPVELSARAMAALPAELRVEIRQALVTLDVKGIARAVAKVAEYDAALGAALVRCAETYRYTAILGALEAGDGKPDSAST